MQLAPLRSGVISGWSCLHRFQASTPSRSMFRCCWFAMAFLPFVANCTGTSCGCSGNIHNNGWELFHTRDNLHLVTYLRTKYGGFYTVASVGRAPARVGLPKSKITFADAVSLSNSHPHVHECQRSSSVFGRRVPQVGHMCEV